MTMNQPKTLVDWLDDLTVRFLLNLPPSELSSVPRLCFQVEEAQWFYEDFVRPAVAASGSPPLPSLHLRQFCLLLFQHCPLLSGFTGAQHIAAYEEFLAYKVRVPVRGAIMLDETMEKVLLVRGWKKGASWSFPRGKINKDEPDLDCAVREVYEETGYDARQAGVVPENEEEVKFIDITMREQHMRLFVFRGIPESTHFEPKTRKEIGAIQWYAIKDLPGFKKQKASHDGESMNANKFYMVAPFLGHLKKWITQQRKLDKIQPSKAAIHNGNAIYTATEDDDEAEMDDEMVPEVEVQATRKSEDLMRLLSGNQPMPASVPSKPQKADGHADNLLAMLQGKAKPPHGSQMPQTPLDQMNAFPLQPQTPQLDHLRHPSISQQHIQPPPSQFPLSPQRINEQQRQQQLPTPHVFGPGPNGQPPFGPSGFPGMFPPHMQQQSLQQRPNVPLPAPQMPFAQQGGLPFNGPPQHPMLPQQMPFQGPFHQMFGPPDQRPPSAYMAQGPQGVIAGGPAVPNASQLPAPRLNAQSMQLLNAFRSGAQKPASPAASTVRVNRPASTHQAALLDLFKKPSASTPPAVPADVPKEVPVSPTLTDVTEKPAKLERRTTLNEITRTLPLKLKAKSPPVVHSPSETPQSQPAVERERPQPKSRELFDPSAPTKLFPNQKPNYQGQQSPSLTPGQSVSRGVEHSPKMRKSSPAGSPSRTGASTTQRNSSQPTPAFTILARPSSVRGPKSPAPPPSPLRNESQQAAFQPQLLKRPKAADAFQTEPNPADKKEHLLALFGKSSPTTASAISTPPQPPTITPPQQQQPPPPRTDASTHQSTLLNLFNTPPVSSLNLPSAPRLEPERRPSSQTKSTPQQQPTNPLLNLFTTRNSIPNAPGTLSPSTPISPFTLGGAPASASSMQSRFPPMQATGSTGSEAARSRVGSGPASPDGSVRSPAETPTEAREFLRGFLDGVVRKEGYRGMKGSG